MRNTQGFPPDPISFRKPCAEFFCKIRIVQIVAGCIAEEIFAVSDEYCLMVRIDDHVYSGLDVCVVDLSDGIEQLIDLLSVGSFFFDFVPLDGIEGRGAVDDGRVGGIVPVGIFGLGHAG